jgi:hypothetical protein
MFAISKVVGTRRLTVLSLPFSKDSVVFNFVCKKIVRGYVTTNTGACAIKTIFITPL